MILMVNVITVIQKSNHMFINSGLMIMMFLKYIIMIVEMKNTTSIFEKTYLVRLFQVKCIIGENTYYL